MVIRRRQKKGRYNFLIDSSVYDQYSAICDDLGLIRGKNLENFMKSFIGSPKSLSPARNSGKRNMKKGRYNFMIEEKVYRDFSAVCDEVGLIRSKLLENYMKEFIEKNR